jgi:basic amino acid/polyamine antiporter, APA family
MALKRTIGRWSLTALIVNTVIGSGVFGIPSVVNGVVGRASPIAMIIAGLGMGLMMACFAEVASQFSEAGGAYLYVRTALGSFAGMQVAWFSWLAPIGACAASANLFMDYLAGFFPPLAGGPSRIAILCLLLGALTLANYVGVRSGTNLSNVFTIAKLAPLILLIGLGLWRFGLDPVLLPPSEVIQPGAHGWMDALLLLAFAYAGFETALIPTGEMKDPRTEIPVALAVGLFVCIATYTLVQFIVVVTIGTGPFARPLAAAASILIGRSGAALVTVAAMISTYGSVSAMVLATPRLTFSMSQAGEFPSVFAKIHSRFLTPHISVLAFGGLTLLMAATGTFAWLLTLASGAIIITYAAVCVSLIVLRRRRPDADALRIPGGVLVACVCLVIALVLLSRLSQKEALLLGATSVVAFASWLAVRERKRSVQ